MTQPQPQKNGTDKSNDLGKSGIEQGSSQVVQELVRKQELLDSRVEFVDDLNHAMEQIDERVQMDRASGKYEQFTINGLNSAVEAVKNKYKVGSLQARRYLAETEAVKKNRKLASFLKQDIDRAEAFTRIRASFEKIIFHHLSTIVTKFVVGFANQLEKAANIGETIKQKKEKKKEERALEDKALLDQQRKMFIFGQWPSVVEKAIGLLSVDKFPAERNLLGDNSFMKKTSDLEKKYITEFARENWQDNYKGERFFGPLEVYEGVSKAGAKVNLSIGNFKQKLREAEARDDPEYRNEAKISITPPSGCVIAYYDVKNKHTGNSTLTWEMPSHSIDIKLNRQQYGAMRFYVIQIDGLNSKVLESFEFELPTPRKDYR